jgi:hypothetical protein
LIVEFGHPKTLPRRGVRRRKREPQAQKRKASLCVSVFGTGSGGYLRRATKVRTVDGEGRR